MTQALQQITASASQRRHLAPRSAVRLSGLAGLLCAVLIASGCATPPPPPAPKVNRSYVVLLDNGDGTTGKVHVTGRQGGLTVLATALEGTLIEGDVGNHFAVDESILKNEFGAAITASPRRPTTFRLYFESGGAKLTAASRSELPRILAEIGSRPAPDLSIVGHTDTTGDDASNMALGMQRARQVAGFLSAGDRVPTDKIALESHGEKNLLVSTSDNTEEPRNRRVEVTVR